MNERLVSVIFFYEKIVFKINSSKIKIQSLGWVKKNAFENYRAIFFGLFF